MHEDPKDFNSNKKSLTRWLRRYDEKRLDIGESLPPVRNIFKTASIAYICFGCCQIHFELNRKMHNCKDYKKGIETLRSILGKVELSPDTIISTDELENNKKIISDQENIISNLKQSNKELQYEKNDVESALYDFISDMREDAKNDSSLYTYFQKRIERMKDDYPEIHKRIMNDLGEDEED